MRTAVPKAPVFTIRRSLKFARGRQIPLSGTFGYGEQVFLPMRVCTGTSTPRDRRQMMPSLQNVRALPLFAGRTAK